MMTEQQQRPDVRRFALSAIHPDKNARTTFDEAELIGLADSLRDSQGPLQPLLGVLRPDGEVDLIAGERRWRASKIANVETVEVKLVVCASPKDRLKWNLVENLQREPLKPMEVAQRVTEMLALTTDGVPLYSQAGLAIELGKNTQFISCCTKAMVLAPKVKAAIDAGTICLETGAMLGALPEAMRDEAAKSIVFPPYGGAMDRDKARRYIADNYRRDLRKAQFKKDDATLLPSAGPCTACPNWGGNRDDVEGKTRESVCLNPKCYEAKIEQHQAMVRSHAEEQGTKVLNNADKLFQSWNDELRPESGYSELKCKPDAHLLAVLPQKAPTWEKAIEGQGVEVVIAFDHKGSERRLVATKVAIEAAAMGEYASHFKAGADKSVVDLDEKRFDAQITKAENKAKEQGVLEACVELLQALSVPHDRVMKLALLKQILESGHTRDDTEMLCRVLQPDVKMAGDNYQQLMDLVETNCPRLEQLEGFIVLSKNIRSIRYNGLSHVVSEMDGYCKAVEFNAVRWKAEIVKREKTAATEARAKVKVKIEAEKAAEQRKKAKASPAPEAEVEPAEAVVEPTAAADELATLQAAKAALKKPKEAEGKEAYNAWSAERMRINRALKKLGH